MTLRHSGDHPHKTLADLLRHRADCEACAHAITEQMRLVRETMEKQAADLRAMVLGIADATSKLAHDALLSVSHLASPSLDRKAIHSIIEGATGRIHETLRGIATLAEYGWLIPDEMSLDDVDDLLSKKSDSAALDLALEAFFTSDNGRQMEALKESLVHHKQLEHWRPLIEEAFFAIRSEKYRISVPALFAVFEGVASESWTEDFDTQGGRKGFFRSKLRTLDPDSFEFLDWTAKNVFVEAVYQTAGKRKGKPLRLNRHWIMHGRGLPDGRLGDCLRLLLAIRAAADTADGEA